MYIEPSREIPVLGTYDVIVCGGGPAGCAAALSAARHGARTLLLEKNGYLGGAPATQLITSILTTNGVDLQGVWHEWIRRLQAVGGVSDLRHHTKPLAEYILTGQVDPERVKRVWDELLAESGVTVLHHVLCADAIVEAGSCAGVVVETVGGRRAVYGSRVIDCTGDGHVCAQAGVGWDCGSERGPYGMACALIARLVATQELSSLGGPQTEQVKRQLLGEDGCGGMLADAYPNDRAGFTQAQDRTAIRPFNPVNERLLPNVYRVPTKYLTHVDPLDPFDLTRAEREGQQYAWAYVDLVRKYVPGAESVRAILANQLAVRASRRIHGLATVTARDVWRFEKYPDGIARASWDIDIYDPYHNPEWSVARHTPAYQARIDKMVQGEYYDIRYGAIVAKGVDNLLVAGRCISADYVAQSSLRIQQTCISTGQAAGTAAALSLQVGVTPRELDPALVVRELERDRAVEPAFEALRDLPRLYQTTKTERRPT